MADQVRRRDTAIPGPRKRWRTTPLVWVVVILILLLFLWFALQTLGGHATKG